MKIFLILLLIIPSLCFSQTIRKSKVEKIDTVYHGDGWGTFDNDTTPSIHNIDTYCAQDNLIYIEDGDTVASCKYGYSTIKIYLPQRIYYIQIGDATYEIIATSERQQIIPRPKGTSWRAISDHGTITNYYIGPYVNTTISLGNDR